MVALSAGWFSVCAAVALEAQVASSVPLHPSGAVLFGTILDRSDEARVAGAVVLLMRAPEGERVALAEADSTGSFVFPPVSPGAYSLSIQRIGYRALVQDVVLAADVQTQLTASLVAEAVDLEPVVVTVARRASGVMADFERRRALGMGSFITREDIERQRPMLTTDLFRRIPSVRVVTDRLGDARLVMRGRCVPKLYIDGVAAYERVSLDLSLPPTSVEAIEVYSNATVPVQYANEACGVVLVWTRVPERGQGRGGWWKPLLVIGGVLGTISLIR